MVKLSIIGPNGFSHTEKDIFDNAEYYDCKKFNYTYDSAVNNYNCAHSGCSKNNQFSGKVISPEDWEQLTTDLRAVVGDVNMRNIVVQIYNWAYDKYGAGHLQTGYAFRNGGRIIAYAVWDRANLSGEMVTRITDDGYIIG